MSEKFSFKPQQENPRLQELRTEGDTVTPEEKAELMALTRASSKK